MSERNKPNIIATDIKEFKLIEDKLKDLSSDAINHVHSVELIPISNMLLLIIKFPPKDLSFPSNPISITESEKDICVYYQYCMFKIDRKFENKFNYRFG